MTRAARDLFANPSSAHALGAAAARALEEARARGRGSCWARRRRRRSCSPAAAPRPTRWACWARRARARGRHLVVSAIEHPAVMRTAETLVGQGYELTVVPPGRSGVVARRRRRRGGPPRHRGRRGHAGQQRARHHPAGRRDRARAGADRARAPAPPAPARRRACRRSASCALRSRALGADTLALSGHKLHGPQGAGALWVRPGARLAPLWVGGGKSAGCAGAPRTCPALVGFGRRRRAGAAQRDAQRRGARARRCAIGWSARCWRRWPTWRLTERAPDGDRRAARAAHRSLAFPGLPAEPLLHALEARGVLASAGSACASRTRGPQPVLKAIGVDDTDGGAALLAVARDHRGRRRRRRVAALREAHRSRSRPHGQDGARDGRTTPLMDAARSSAATASSF